MKVYVLHVHGDTTLSDDDWRLAKYTIASLDNVADLQREVVPCTFVTPIERFEWEHALCSQIERN